MKKKNSRFDVIEKAFKKNNDWINVLKSFGCEKELAKDICQEMYIQLHSDLNKGLDITYGNDVNYYYIYKILRGMYLNYKKKINRLVVFFINRCDFGFAFGTEYLDAYTWIKIVWKIKWIKN